MKVWSCRSCDAPISTLWHLVDHKNPMNALERRRPRDEVLAATLLRALHSNWQLREVMCNFWHDHFNVDTVGSEAIGVALSAYDRDVIRRHSPGNFREFLEAVATSAAMQYYLSSRSSRAGSANENFARELFELHSLGRGAYLNDHYDRWREVPGALQVNDYRQGLTEVPEEWHGGEHAAVFPGFVAGEQLGLFGPAVA